MKLLTFAISEQAFTPRLGVVLGDVVVDLVHLGIWASRMRGISIPEVPASMLELLHAGSSGLAKLNKLVSMLEPEDLSDLQGEERGSIGYPLDDVIHYPPLVRPMSVRDFYAFEKHVITANTIRDRQPPEEWYQFPVFYFSNPNSLYGHRQPIPYPSYTQALDYELEIACIIGKQAINIPADQAEEYIFGYTIFNDWSARDIQRQETKVGLGPAKAKDFASSMGPWITTIDELIDKRTDRPGVFDLQMTAQVNGKELTHGNLKDIHYSFGELLERASQDVYLLAGDVIGSGTVGTGCLLELTMGQGPWLQPGDVVRLEVERLGILENRIQTQQSAVHTGES